MLKNGKKLMKKEKVSGGMINMANTCYRIPEESFHNNLSLTKIVTDIF